jgi:hypothetical protein
MRLQRFVVLVGAVVALATPAAGHHGAADLFDETKTIQSKGVVVDWRLVNPHPILRIEVAEASGEKAVWDISFGPSAASALRRRGFSDETFKKGQVIAVQGFPAKTAGVRGIDVRGPQGKVTGEDGKAIP